MTVMEKVLVLYSFVKHTIKANIKISPVSYYMADFEKTNILVK